MQRVNLPILFGTLRHLKPKQLLYRLWYATRAAEFLRLRVRPVPHAPDSAPLQARVLFPFYRWLDEREIDQGRFRFLNDEHRFNGQIDWQIKEKNRLWRYNLHYFNYLHPEGGLAPNVGFRLLGDWIENNPPGTDDAWDPFPTSLRIVNWIKYLSTVAADESELKKMLSSIYQQSLWLERSIEHHLMGNHLFKNAKGLIFAGLFFKTHDASRWLSKGLKLLNCELEEQILPDGGHFERSPMYHSMILEDCLDLLNVLQSCRKPRLNNVAERLRAVSRKMMSFLLGMTHPDGQIALFNDAAFGIECPPANLKNYYEKVLGEEVLNTTSSALSFPDSGYFVMTPQPEDRLLIDCGPIGPDYQPGHGHCDTLSFELSLKGRRVIVDSGCFGYEDSPIRQYNRGNLGHNTLTIDGQNQSEIWNSHRCARRARPLCATLMKKTNGDFVFEGAHDGYRRLRESPIHHRQITSSKGSYIIEDIVKGRDRHDIESRLHIHPLLTVDLSDGDAVVRDKPQTLTRISSLHNGKIQMTEGWYCPEFGVKKKCVVLRMMQKNVRLPYEGGWRIQTLH